MKHIFLLCLSFAFVTSRAQVNVRDSLANGWIFGLGLANHWKGGDIAETFGSNLDLSFDVLYKTRSNFLLGAGGGFQFGQNVKIEDRIFQDIQTRNGQIIDYNGNLATVRLFERGFTADAKVGYIFNGLGHNVNSGLVILLGGGWIRHRIRIENIGENAPQVGGEYAKGYDRLRMGWQVNQFIGYMHAGNRKTVNFLIGLDLRQAFTESMRGYQYDLRQTLTGTHTDLYYGLRFIWFLPVWDTNTQTFFYN